MIDLKAYLDAVEKRTKYGITDDVDTLLKITRRLLDAVGSIAAIHHPNYSIAKHWDTVNEPDKSELLATDTRMCREALQDVSEIVKGVRG